MKTAFWLAGATVLALANPAMAGDTIKIGFVSTFSGPTAVIGNDMRNSFELALDHMGRKMGGKPVEVIYEDDTFKPDVGKRKTEKLIQSDKVDFIAGYIWSNVLLASLKPIVDSKTMLVIANAGPSQVAGELCSPYVFSTSWQNDQTPQAMGEYMNQKGVKSVFLIGPNYAAGKDMLAGVKSTFKGEIKGEEYTVWPSQLDFSAELSKARASGAASIFVFYPVPPACIPQSIYAGRHEGADAALHGVHHRRTDAGAAEGERARRSRRAAMGQRSAQRAEQEVRRRLPQEVHRPASDLLRRAVL
jgi:branched-chain amino acid transport system substrate-binding protein